jgi:PAS domain S-box-containing protein
LSLQIINGLLWGILGAFNATNTCALSWLSVPLVASGQYLGFVSVGHIQPDLFTNEHLRRAELLAIPAAVAIQNARLYQTAQIHGSELEKRLADLEPSEAALAESENSRRISEEQFQKVFQSSPIPFSITTVKEGWFLEANAAFERRYGYLREEGVGHSVHELRIWDDPADRDLMIAQLNKRGPIRNVMTRASHEVWRDHAHGLFRRPDEVRRPSMHSRRFGRRAQI